MGGTGEHSVLFEFADHLLLFETPISDARTLAVIAKARETVPGKPLTMGVTSHHHFDHAGGFRAAVSEGLTLLMYKDNVALFKEVASRPHTINPDALAKSPRVFKFQAVDDKLTLKDATMEVVLYHVKGDVHADTELMAWVPRERILVEADQLRSQLAAASVGRELPEERGAAQAERRQDSRGPRDRSRAVDRGGADDQDEGAWAGRDELDGRRFITKDEEPRRTRSSHT